MILPIGTLIEESFDTLVQSSQSTPRHTVFPQAKTMIKVSWETDDPKTLQREQRALEQAQSELGIKGRIVTLHDYLSREIIEESI